MTEMIKFTFAEMFKPTFEFYSHLIPTIHYILLTTSILFLWKVLFLHFIVPSMECLIPNRPKYLCAELMSSRRRTLNRGLKLNFERFKYLHLIFSDCLCLPLPVLTLIGCSYWNTRWGGNFNYTNLSPPARRWENKTKQLPTKALLPHYQTKKRPFTSLGDCESLTLKHR